VLTAARKKETTDGADHIQIQRDDHPEFSIQYPFIDRRNLVDMPLSAILTFGFGE